MKWCIPDISEALRDQIRRETFITNEIIIQHEAHKAGKLGGCENDDCASSADAQQ